MIANANNNPITYAIYARYSCTLQNERSCDDQIEAIQADVRRRFPQWQHFSRQFKDEAERGGSVVNRHGFQEMLRLALEPNPPFNAIVIEDLSRFARNKHESTKYRHMLALNGVSVLSMADGYIDESTEAGLWLTGIKELKAEADSREMARRVKRGQRAKAKLGFSTGRPTNYGYRRQIVTDPSQVDIDGHPKRVGIRLEPNPIEAAVIQRIFQMYTVQGKSVKAIAATINAEGLRNRRGKPFCSTFIRWVLRNPIYIGKLIYGKRREIRIDSGQRLMKPVPAEEWTVTENGVPPLISQETWDQAQKQIKEREKAGRRFGHKRPPDQEGVYFKYPFSGLIKCAECGKVFSICSSGRINQDNHQQYRLAYYRCSGRSQQGTSFCANETKIIKDEIEERVFSVLDNEVLNLGIVEERAGEWRRLMEREIQKRLSNQDNPQTELAALDSQIANLVNAIAQGIHLDEIQQKIAELKNRRDAIKQTTQQNEALRQALESQLDFDLVKRAVVNSKLALAGRDNLSKVRKEIAKFIEGIYVEPNGRVTLKAYKYSPISTEALNLPGKSGDLLASLDGRGDRI